MDELALFARRVMSRIGAGDSIFKCPHLPLGRQQVIWGSSKPGQRHLMPTPLAQSVGDSALLISKLG